MDNIRETLNMVESVFIVGAAIVLVVSALIVFGYELQTKRRA